MSLSLFSTYPRPMLEIRGSLQAECGVGYKFGDYAILRLDLLLGYSTPLLGVFLTSSL